MSAFRLVNEEVVHQGHLLTMVKGTFEGPDGKRFEREIIHHPGAVAVVPLLADGETVMLVRQFRAALGADLLEIPAGMLDVAGEAPEAAAARELEEEIGQRAGRMEQLAVFYNMAGSSDARSIVYLATELTPCERSFHGEEEEHMELVPVALSDVPAMVADGRLCDAKSIIGLCLVEARLRAV